MKRMYLFILPILCSFHATHSMKKLKELRKTIAAPFIKRQQQPTPPQRLTKEQSCVQAIENNDAEQLTFELLLGADVNYISNGKSLFYLACEAQAKQYRDSELVDILVTQEKIDINARNSQESTPLHVACHLGLTATVASMLKKSPQAACFTNKQGFTPLHIAIISQQKECIQKLLSHNISTINHQDYDGNTPFHWTCKNRQFDLIPLLIEQGANTTVQNHKQQTPLYMLFSTYHPTGFQYIFDNINPDTIHQFIHTKDHNNNTQLHLCAMIQTKNGSEIIDHDAYLTFMVSRGIKPAAQNSDGKTALDLAHEACTELRNLYQIEQLPYIQNALHNQEIILVHFLIHADPSPKTKTQLQKPLFRIEATQPEISQNMTQYKDLSQAQKKCLKGIEENDLSLVKQGLSEHADINFYNQHGAPLLSQACTIAKKSIIKELLEQPTINLKAINTRTGDTALHAACKAPYSDRCGREAIVELLLIKDPTLATIASIDGTTPFDIAMMNENTDCLKKILKYNPAVASTITDKFNNETPLYTAVKNFNIKQIELLLDADNKGINHQNNTGDTVLHHACSCTSYSKEICDLVKLLIIRGSDTTIKNHNQATPLIELFSDISAPEFKIVDFLLTEHSDIFETLIQTKDKNQNTQFHLCTQLQVFKNNFEQYLLLLKNNNLDIHAKNKGGRTAVDLAERHYENLYNLYTRKRSPYLKWPFATQEYIYHTFLRVTQRPTSCASFKQIFDQQTTGFPEFPRELIQHIMCGYYALNLETIVAKKYKNNTEYYDDYIENKEKIRQQLLEKPEPKLLWNA
jgi:ankyrin repeat protein